MIQPVYIYIYIYDTTSRRTDLLTARSFLISPLLGSTYFRLSLNYVPKQLLLGRNRFSATSFITVNACHEARIERVGRFEYLELAAAPCVERKRVSTSIYPRMFVARLN